MEKSTSFNSPFFERKTYLLRDFKIEQEVSKEEGGHSFLPIDRITCPHFHLPPMAANTPHCIRRPQNGIVTVRNIRLPVAELKQFLQKTGC